MSVLLKSNQTLAQVLLHRPRALNALNLEMVTDLTRHLNSANCPVLLGALESGFCAGGDVKTIVHQVASGQDATQFFEKEYRLNHLIGTRSKPVIALMDGVTMGGGVGLSMHAPLRIVTERTVFAMPETKIGLVPDVGSSFFLPRLGPLGMYLGLTGTTLKAEEVLLAGIGTHFIHSHRIPSLVSRLSELESDSLESVYSALEEFCVSLNGWDTWRFGGEMSQTLERCFQKSHFDQVVEALESESTEWSRAQLALLKTFSPTALRVTMEMLNRGKNLDFASCFDMEFNVVSKMIKEPDFTNGVTSLLISKPRTTPVWSVNWEDTVELLSPQVITSRYFSKMDKKLGLTPTFKDYPHRTVTGYPSLEDVKAWVTSPKRVGSSKSQLRTWILKNWSHPLKIGLPQRVDSLLNFVRETPSGLVMMTSSKL